MSRALQLLVAVTCVAVLGAIGYWVWKPEAPDRPLVDGSRFAVCRDLLSAAGRNEASITGINACLELGYISVAEVEAAGGAPLLEAVSIVRNADRISRAFEKK